MKSEIIDTIRPYQSICPNCSTVNKLSDVEIFTGKPTTEQAIKIYEEKLREIQHRKDTLAGYKDANYNWLTVNTKSINVGFIMERLVLTMDQFNYNHNDCRPMFDPIDYVIFHGLYENREVDRITFVDIKTGNAKLTKGQKEIAQVINDKNVKFRTY